jgi:hypothetical protein
VIEKESLNFKELEYVLVEKVVQLFRINRKNAADGPAIWVAEDLPVAAILGKVTVCVQVSRHGRGRA